MARNESEGEDNDIEEIENDAKNIWTHEREKIFILLMEEEVIKGNRVTTTFNKESWRHIREELRKRAKCDYSFVQIRNKFNQLRLRYTNFNKLLKDTGVGYVAATGQIIATEEVWNRLYTVHKMAKRFRKKGCPQYDKLCIIYGDTSATGFNARPSTLDPSDSDQGENYLHHEMDEQADEQEAEEDMVTRSNTVKKRGRTLSTSNMARKKQEKESFQAVLTNALHSLSENSKKKIEFWEKMMENTSQSMASVYDNNDAFDDQNNKDWIDCMDILETLDVDDAAYARAVEKFHDDKLWREMFLRMPDHRKKGWVLNLK